mmetsp:Transcript_47177/g.110308  ORF Transcript_47177/g.110308 Transcript_47177/m.110308 type:complete len:206 (-) Transcript_47177:2193-2810(-)
MLWVDVRDIITRTVPKDIQRASAASTSSRKPFLRRKPAVKCRRSSSSCDRSAGGENSATKFSIPRGAQPFDFKSSTSRWTCNMPFMSGPVDQTTGGSTAIRSPQSWAMLATARGQCFSRARVPSCRICVASGWAAMAEKMAPTPPPDRDAFKANSSLDKAKRARTEVFCSSLSERWLAIAFTMVRRPRCSRARNEDPSRAMIRMP